MDSCDEEEEVGDLQKKPSQEYLDHNSEEEDEDVKDEDQFDEKNINEQEDEDDMEDFNQENKLSPKQKLALEELVGRFPPKKEQHRKRHQEKDNKHHSMRFRKQHVTFNKHQVKEDQVDDQINNLI